MCFLKIYVMPTDYFETLHIWPLIGSTLYFRKHHVAHFTTLPHSRPFAGFFFRTFILKHRQEVTLDRWSRLDAGALSPFPSLPVCVCVRACVCLLPLLRVYASSSPLLQSAAAAHPRRSHHAEEAGRL